MKGRRTTIEGHLSNQEAFFDKPKYILKFLFMENKRVFFRFKNTASYRQQARFKMNDSWPPKMVALSNGLLLIIENFFDCSTTSLNLLNPKTKTIIAKRLIKAPSIEVIPLSDDGLLLKLYSSDKLYILSSNNLETLEDLQETISNFDTSCSLSDNRLLSIHKKTTDDTEFTLMSHDLRTKQFHQIVSLPVLIKHDYSRTVDKIITHDYHDYSPTVDKIIKLDNDQIAFHVFDHFNNYSKFFVFEKNWDSKHEYSLSHIIHPKTSPARGTTNFTSGGITALSKGRLLTYDDGSESFQIWNGKDCVKEWHWPYEIQCEDKFFNVVVLPDGDHLLVDIGNELFICDLETLQIQSVDLGELYVWGVCVLQNGQTVISTSDKNCKKNQLLVIDFAYMTDYRNKITTLLSENIGKDAGSIVNGYLGHDELWVNNEDVNKKGRCVIS